MTKIEIQKMWWDCRAQGGGIGYLPFIVLYLLIYLYIHFIHMILGWLGYNTDFPPNLADFPEDFTLFPPRLANFPPDLADFSYCIMATLVSFAILICLIYGTKKIFGLDVEDIISKKDIDLKIAIFIGIYLFVVVWGTLIFLIYSLYLTYGILTEYIDIICLILMGTGLVLIMSNKKLKVGGVLIIVGILLLIIRQLTN